MAYEPVNKAPQPLTAVLKERIKGNNKT